MLINILSFHDDCDLTDFVNKAYILNQEWGSRPSHIKHFLCEKLEILGAIDIEKLIA